MQMTCKKWGKVCLRCVKLVLKWEYLEIFVLCILFCVILCVICPDMLNKLWRNRPTLIRFYCPSQRLLRQIGLSHRIPAEQCYSPLCRLNRVFWGHMGDQSRDRLIARQRRRPGRKVQFQLFAEFTVVIHPAPCGSDNTVTCEIRLSVHIAVGKTLYYVQKNTTQFLADWPERPINIFSREWNIVHSSIHPSSGRSNSVCSQNSVSAFNLRRAAVITP